MLREQVGKPAQRATLPLREKNSYCNQQRRYFLFCGQPNGFSKSLL
ncbi:hypothetical protein [Nostoc sp. WHI]|nr:hypothetical protein [Nostoc sp. WHI]